MFNILLQLLDDGRLTDNQGRTVDFKNTVVIMTSNIGSAELTENISPDGTIPQEVKDRVEGQLKNYFRPEFLNRIDDIVVFSPLTEEQVIRITELSMKALESRLADRNITLELTDDAKKFIASEAYDPNYGARPVKRYIQRNIETKLAEMIIKGDVADGDRVEIAAGEDGLKFNRVE